MSVLKKLKNTMEFQSQLSEDGMNPKNLKLLEHKEDIGDSISLKKEENEKLSIAEFLHPNKSQIFKTRLNTCPKNIKIMKLSLISGQGSTSKELGLTPFWIPSLVKTSKRLWFPHKTGSPDLGSQCFKIFSLGSVPCSKVILAKNLKVKNKSLLKTSFQSLQFSLPDITVLENTKQIKMRKIRIYPTKKQKNLFEKYFGASRFVHNIILEHIKKRYKNAKHNKKQVNIDKKTIRKLVVDECSKKEWMKDILYETKDSAIRKFIAARKSGISNIKAGNIKYFDMKYKSKRNGNQTFGIPSNSVSKLGTKRMNLKSGAPKKIKSSSKKKKKETQTNKINRKRIRKTGLILFPTKHPNLGRLRMRNKNYNEFIKDIGNVNHECEISKNSSLKYYIHIHIDNTEKPENKCSCDSVALDPGVRTFQTFYSADGIAGELGKDFIKKRIIKHRSKIDYLDGIECNGKTKYNIRKRKFLLRTKIKNIVSNLHWKSANFLCKNFKTIIIPKFETRKMVRKYKRNINKTTVRNLLTLSHYKFLQRLTHKAKQYRTNLIHITEEYTSKTCGNCGILNNVGSSKEYNCEKCLIKIDRDINAARNIMLKASLLI